MAVYDTGTQSGATSNDITRILEAFRTGGMSPETLYAQLRAIGYTAELANHVVQSEVATRAAVDKAFPTPTARAAAEAAEAAAKAAATPPTPPTGVFPGPGLAPGDIAGRLDVSGGGTIAGAVAGGNLPKWSISESDEISGGGGGAVAGAVAGGNLSPGTPAELRRDMPLENPFRAYLNQQVPAGGYGPFRGYLENQREPLESLYRLGQFSGDLPDTTSFYDYLGGIGGIQRPNPSAFAAYARRGSEALSGPVSENDPALRGYLLGETEEGINSQTGLNRQFNLGLAGAYPTLAREARPFIAKQAKNAFENFQYNEPGKDFLPWLINRGYKFFGS